ncbi:endosome-associated-trafficking regulator 1 isoform X2 [Hemicordylus capensis]|uniref:endosome-associated-trafficking regulator 1 isoform X2 n=1 Tax=Hemicordylus capensis TaxID=884348 RepID=UPI002302E7F8|nr:endosome-associated-trafficking regulator 1 isoform X2 [Hemicordylus capensis]
MHLTQPLGFPEAADYNSQHPSLQCPLAKDYGSCSQQPLGITGSSMQGTPAAVTTALRGREDRQPCRARLSSPGTGLRLQGALQGPGGDPGGPEGGGVGLPDLPTLPPPGLTSGRLPRRPAAPRWPPSWLPSAATPDWLSPWSRPGMTPPAGTGGKRVSRTLPLGSYSLQGHLPRADALISPGEEANPFSFKEFVRSKKQSAVLGSQPVRDVGLEPQGGGGSSSSSPKTLADLTPGGNTAKGIWLLYTEAAAPLSRLAGWVPAVFSVCFHGRNYETPREKRSLHNHLSEQQCRCFWVDVFLSANACSGGNVLFLINGMCLGLQARSSVLSLFKETSRSAKQESSRFSFRLDSEASSPELLGLSLEFREPFFPDPVAESSLLEDEEEDWSSTYQPSAVEEAHSARASGTLLSSTSDLSDLQTFSPWQLGGSSSLPHAPLGKEEQSLPVDGAALGEDVYPPLRQSYEELKQENAKLRNLICHLQAVSETQAERVKQLERTLEESKRKEAQEAQDLEAMVQQVEENLQLMTKRAMKAESSAVKLKQENALLQVQMENCTLEKENLRASHSANLAVMKQNADIALQNLLTVVSKSRSSIKQLLSGAEALQLVAELLKSIDKISEIPKDSP